MDTLKLDKDSQNTLRRIKLIERISEQFRTINYSELFNQILRLDESDLDALESSLNKKRMLFVVNSGFCLERRRAI